MFHLDLNQIKYILKKNFYPEHLIDKTNVILTKNFLRIHKKNVFLTQAVILKFHSFEDILT